MSDGSELSSDAMRLTDWVREHGRSVYGYLFALTRRADVAEDLTQDVFRRAWQAREQYSEQGSPKAYLLRIADRLVIDYSRRKRLEVHLDEDGWRIYQPHAVAAAPESGLESSESLSRLRESMQNLSPPQRRVLLMRFFGDLDFESIAQQMQSPLGTVLSHCHRGLAKLRKLMVESES
jgi:RNA polymerase sigma-70 factor (ECF subfamily)